MSTWQHVLNDRCEAVFARHGVEMTLGGEPTFVPVEPEGAEWNYSAVGPTKFGYAKKMAQYLLKHSLPGGADFFSPGKSYPGELNPRWAIRLLANRDGSPMLQTGSRAVATEASLETLRSEVAAALGVRSCWKVLPDPLDAKNTAWALVLDQKGEVWKSFSWPGRGLTLTSAAGPAGLRLPLHRLPKGVPGRALTLEFREGRLSIFLPPVLQGPFLALLRATERGLQVAGIGRVHLQGYVPKDESLVWTQLGLAADPGVLEINLPACRDWKEYDRWIHAVTKAAEACGLRSWKHRAGHFPEGTGGGNHLLWGGPTVERNPFFTRPGWLASILRYWQRHPSLAYLFTGCYVGASSQAPRADESARDRYDLEMAISFLEALPEGDHRHLISETLRHLQTDVTGNSHRSEISLDKFWNVGWPAGTLGLIEFRAIESLPKAAWMSGVALLWSALAAFLLEKPVRGPLRDLTRDLHDRFFLPSVLWEDLSEILGDLRQAGFGIQEKLFRDIWAWRFPVLLEGEVDGAKFTVRRALESWPLLCETPVDGGTTSRFVDTSMDRLEILAEGIREEGQEIRAGNRPLAMQEFSSGRRIAALRYRRTNLYPSLHPGLPPQLPLELSFVSGSVAHKFLLRENDSRFQTAGVAEAEPAGLPCRKSGRGARVTFDLRIC